MKPNLLTRMWILARRVSRVTGRLGWSLAWLVAPLLRLQRNRRGTIVLPPADEGSFGDEAMVFGLLSCLPHDRVTYLPYRSRGWNGLPEHVARGPELFNPLASVRLFMHLLRNSHFYLIGADVLDGYYSVAQSGFRLRLAAIAERAGLKTRIVCFSINDSPPATTVRQWKRLPARVGLSARDPVSASRLQQLLQRPVEHFPDLAFIGGNDEVSFDRPETKGYVVFVPNYHFLSRYGHSYLDTFTRIVTGILSSKPELGIVLVPHDLRGTMSDLDICIEIESRTNTPRVTVAVSVRHHTQVRYIMEEAQAVVTARMHGAIAALVAGTPPVVIGYQGKAEGMMGLVNMSEHVVSAEPSFDVSRVTALLTEAIEGRDRLGDQISRRVSVLAAYAIRHSGA